ncbi:uncharacterized protein LOC114455298 [Gouania willdenowi]|uniref:uncharacterized protein LOC114455298 n=1 Tax=Gouania willdenowi TaxID=441366 RepID=UPI0010565DBF|nr:uncharacterized protein LOC114455298 [Gouania willdenowi]
MREDLRGTLVMLDQREILVKMEIQAALVNLEEGGLMAEEVHLVRLEILESQELMVCKESWVLEGLEDHLDPMVHQGLEEKMETLGPGVLEVAQVLLEIRDEGEPSVERESQETLDPRVSLDRLAPEENQVKTAGMDLVFKGRKEERVIKVFQDSLDPRVLQGTLAPEVDLDQEEIVVKEVLLVVLVHLVRREKLDTLGLMVPKDHEGLGLCNVIWLKR